MQRPISISKRFAEVVHSRRKNFLVYSQKELRNEFCWVVSKNFSKKFKKKKSGRIGNWYEKNTLLEKSQNNLRRNSLKKWRISNEVHKVIAESITEGFAEAIAEDVSKVVTKKCLRNWRRKFQIMHAQIF